jgi:hypothetical protein
VRNAGRRCGNTSAGLLSKLKAAYCSAVPSGRIVSVGGSAGTLGGVAGSVDVVTNYGSGQVSAFASGGGFAGFNGGGSANVSYGQIYGNLASNNSNFSGPFTAASGSVGFFGGSIARSSAGFRQPLSFSGPTIVSASLGASMFGPVTFAGSVTTSSQPLQLGNFVNGTAPAPTLTDYLFYALRQPCK